MNDNLQYFLGTVVLLLGVFVIAGAAAAAVIKAIREALPAKDKGVVAADAQWKLPDPLDIIKALLSGPITGAVVVGGLIIWLGICMTSGGTWLWFVELSNPNA